MKRSLVVVGLTAAFVSNLGLSQAHASDIVERVIDQVRARVCTEEYGYGVVNCSETVDPLVDEVFSYVPTQEVIDLVTGAEDTVMQEVERLPGTIQSTVDYVECWVLHPEAPEC